MFDGYICESGSIDYCATMKKNVSEYSEAHKTVEYGGDCSTQVLIFNTVVSDFINTMKTTFYLGFEG